MKLRRAKHCNIRAEWHEKPQISNAELFTYLKKNPDDQDAESGRRGDSRRAQPMQPDRSRIRSFRRPTPFLISLTFRLSPGQRLPNGRAEIDGVDRLSASVWCAQRARGGIRLPEEQVRVIVPDTGSAYGGKHSGECAIEAARLAKAAGKPVKLVWTREEEFTWAYFRPAGVIEISSGVSKDGTAHRLGLPQLQFRPSGIETPYEIPNKSIRFHSTKSPLKQGSYRGLAATANHFARESHMDELAERAEVDPLEFRLRNLKDPRMRAVLQAAAEQFGWGRKQDRNRAMATASACGTEKGATSRVAPRSRCTTDAATLRVERVVEAFECGAVVNPEQLKSQIEGAVVMGLGGALLRVFSLQTEVF